MQLVANVIVALLTTMLVEVNDPVYRYFIELETVSIAEALQNRQHARLMLSTLERKGKREG